MANNFSISYDFIANDKGLSKMLENLDKSFKNFEQTATKMSGSVKKAFDTIGNKFNNFHKNLSSFDIAIAGVMGFASKNILNTAGDLEKFDLVFSTLLKNKNLGKEFSNTLLQFANITPYEFEHLGEQAGALIASGIKSSDLLKKGKNGVFEGLLVGFSDISAATGASMDTLMLSYMEIMNMGHMQGQHSRMLQTVPINDYLIKVLDIQNKIKQSSTKNGDQIAKIINDELGKGIPKATEKQIEALKHLQHQGLITSSIFAEAMKLLAKDHAGLTEKMRTNINVATQDIGKNILSLFGKIMQSGNDEFGLGKGINKISDSIANLTEKWDKLSPVIKKTSAAILMFLLGVPILTGALGIILKLGNIIGVFAGFKGIITILSSVFKFIASIPALLVLYGPAIRGITMAINAAIFSTVQWASSFKGVLGIMGFGFTAITLYFKDWNQLFQDFSNNGFWRTLLNNLDLLVAGFFAVKGAIWAATMARAAFALAVLNPVAAVSVAAIAGVAGAGYLLHKHFGNEEKNALLTPAESDAISKTSNSPANMQVNVNTYTNTIIDKEGKTKSNKTTTGINSTSNLALIDTIVNSYNQVRMANN